MNCSSKGSSRSSLFFARAFSAGRAPRSLALLSVAECFFLCASSAAAADITAQQVVATEAASRIERAVTVDQITRSLDTMKAEAPTLMVNQQRTVQ
jgi:hypothetical protein